MLLRAILCTATAIAGAAGSIRSCHWWVSYLSLSHDLLCSSEIICVVVSVVFRNGVRRPVAISVKVPKTGTVATLKSEVERMRPGSFVPAGSESIAVHVRVFSSRFVCMHACLFASTWLSVQLLMTAQSQACRVTCLFLFMFAGACWRPCCCESVWQSDC